MLVSVASLEEIQEIQLSILAVAGAGGCKRALLGSKPYDVGSIVIVQK